jgi:uncharacterized membrane protein YdjX (TVP38/TMEM64 family)
MSQRIAQSSGKLGQTILSHHDSSSRGRSKSQSILWTILILLLGIALVITFFYLDRHNRISNLIQSSGGWGIVASIVLMFLFCIIPVPSEFLIILNMKVFGVWSGILYSWIGSLSGSVAVFLIARYFARDLLKRFISEKHMRRVETWIGHRGVLGLILVRIVPLPFIVTNYTAGVVRSISLWNFIWTSVVGGIPYYVGAALLFLGISKKYIIWLVIGGIAILAIWIIGYLYNRSTNKLAR